MDFDSVEQLSRKDAISFAEEEKYKYMTYEEIAKFQINQRLLCMPFSVFHEAVEKHIGRPVFTHELGVNHYGLREEIFKDR